MDAALGHHDRDRPAHGSKSLRTTPIAWAEAGFNLNRASELLRIHRRASLHELDESTGSPIGGSASR